MITLTCCVEEEQEPFSLNKRDFIVSSHVMK
uniref:Uncharacterized protein n=1 Tax=Anguilla anguilla TaxID=7936 RepID=A0A0E9UU34_ANGAN